MIPTSVSRFHPKSILWYWGPIIAYMAVIFIGSSFSKLPDIPMGFSDKVAHFSEYAVLALLVARGLAGPRWLSITFPYVLAAILVAGLYGMSDEFHQLFVPGRDCDIRDWAADTMGACTSVGTLWAWGIIRRNFRIFGG